MWQGSSNPVVSDKMVISNQYLYRRWRRGRRRGRRKRRRIQRRRCEE